MRLKTLAYTSRARPGLAAQDLLDIHQISLDLNALDRITGLLAFDGTRFLQILEGSPRAVDNLLARLRRDPRHSGLEVRDERPIDRRAFPYWSMQLVRVSAGYLKAQFELDSILPPDTDPQVRALIAAMSSNIAGTFEME